MHAAFLRLDEELFIARLKQKDQAAFKQLVVDSGNKVYNTALGILQNTEDAEDVSQEVFIEVFHSIDRFKGESKLDTWIYRIAITKSLEFLRKKNRKKRFAVFQNLFVAGERSIENYHSDFHHPGVQLEKKEQASVLFTAISKLPDKQKSAFILHKLENLSYSQIAEVLDVSVSSVESLLFRAKQNLQKLLGDYYEKNMR